MRLDQQCTRHELRSITDEGMLVYVMFEVVEEKVCIDSDSPMQAHQQYILSFVPSFSLRQKCCQV